VVGSRASEEVQQACAERLVTWTEQMQRRRRPGALLPARLRAVARRPSMEAIGTQAVRSIGKHTDQTHWEVLALFDELLAIDCAGAPAAIALPPVREHLADAAA
jgi:hypothetical protein